jgi:hypothetical protein
MSEHDDKPAWGRLGAWLGVYEPGRTYEIGDCVEGPEFGHAYQLQLDGWRAVAVNANRVYAEPR